MNNYSTLPTISHDGGATEPSKIWSKKVTKRRRRTAKRDREALGITRVCDLRPPMACDPPLVGITTPPLSDPKPANDDIKAEETPSDFIAAKKPPKIHAWEHTMDPGKLATAYRVLEASGAGVAFTLNCSPDQNAAALRHPKGVADYFARRINRALKRALGYVPLYGFGVDVARDDRLHIQGAAIANDNQLEAMDGALCHAGGKWANPRHSDKQCEFEPLHPADGWATYCLRNQAKVKRLIRGPTISITNPLRRHAKEFWEDG